MKTNAFKASSFSGSNNFNSKILLMNCGFSPDFFNILEENILIAQNNKIKKIKSENDIISLKEKEDTIQQKKVYEAEDKDIYNRKNDITNKIIYSNYNNSSLIMSSLTTLPSQDHLNKKNSEIINKKNNNYMVKAYKSKLKTKYSHLYEINSIELEKKNKSKLYHKCCYPDCKRTFSSSGWLKAHLKSHLKQIHNSKYCKLFENFILNEKLSKINNNIYIKNCKSVNSINNINNISNVSLNNNIYDIEPFFPSSLNFAKPPMLYYNKENNSNLFINNSFLDLNNFNNQFFSQ